MRNSLPHFPQSLGEFHDGEVKKPGGKDKRHAQTDGPLHIAWQATYGGGTLGSTHGSWPIDFVETDGGFIIAGVSDGSTNKVRTEPSCNGTDDIWIIKIDAQGQRLWDKSYGGGFLMVGSSSSRPTTDPNKGTKVSPNDGQFDYWAVRIDAQGNPLWEQSYGGSAEDICQWAEPMPDGGWLLAGESSSYPSGNKSSPRFGASDLWLVRIDDQGNKLWEQSFGGTGNEGYSGASFRY